jgi:hypothetical protein
MSSTDGSGPEPTEAKDKNPFTDRVLVATLIIGIGAILLAYYGEVSYRFVPVPLFSLVLFSIVIVSVVISAVRGRKLNPHMFEDLRRDFSPSTAIHGTVGKVEHSVLLYLSSVFLGLIGGFAGYIAVRKRNRPMANLLLVLGIPATIVYADIIASLLFPAPATLPLPP